MNVSRKPLHVLLVDDNPDDRAVVRGALRASGRQKYFFAECASGDEALAFLAANPAPDCMVLDVHMPSMDGNELLKRLQNEKGDLAFPVIVLTGSADDPEQDYAEANQAITLGAQDYLTKDSVQPDALARTIYNAIERFRLVRRLRDSEERHRLATEAVKLGTWSFEPETESFTCSGRCREIMNFAPEGELTFDQFVSGIHPDDKQVVSELFASLASAREDRAFKTSFRVRLPDASIRWADARGRYSYSEKGGSRLLGTILDITERRRAESQQREEIETLDALFRIAQAFSGAVGRQEAVQQVTDIATELTGAEFGAFFYNNVDERGESYMLYSLSGVRQGEFHGLRMPRNTDVFAHTFNGTGVVRSDDITKDPRYGRNEPYHGTPPTHPKVKSYLAIPVTAKGGGVLGGLFFGHTAVGKFTERAERIAMAIAAQAGIGLENMRLVGESEQQRRLYETILSGTPDLVYIFDLNHRFTYANKALLSMWGKTWNEAIGKNCLELGYEPWHAAMHDREIEQVIATKAPIRGEVPFTGTAGRRIYDYIFVPVIGANGEVEAVAGTTRDVTESKSQQEALRKNDERQRIALEASHGFGVWDWDIVNDCVSADERFGELFGLTPEESQKGVPIKRLVERIHPEDIGRVEQKIREAMETGRRYQEEYRIVQKDGSVRWVTARGHVQKDENGKPVRFPGVGVDVTAEHAAMGALRESEHRFRQLADAMPQSVWGATPDGVLDYYNKRWYDFTGAPEGSLDWEPYFHPEDVPETKERWLRSIETGEPFQMQHRILEGKSGKHVWHLSRALPIHAEDGRIIRWFGTNTNIEELMEARQQAEAANIAKTEFLANMSHEIRTPMNAVIGLANILSLSSPLTQQQRDFIRTLQLSADSLLSLINDLLDIAKIEARTVELEHVPFSLTQLVQETISMTMVRAEEKGLRFTGDVECVKRRMFLGDPTRLRQIVLNLCSNAVKFTEKGGVHIRVTCTPIDDKPGMETICICVEDTGIGIQPDKLGTIFQKFVQADSSINRKYGGTGLGLAITKTLAEIMGGEITVESEPGKGSAFTVCIPLEVAEEKEDIMDMTQPFSTAKEPEGAAQPQILLVEDYAPNVLVATTFLEQFGYACDVAGNGLEAIEKAKSRAYAAVLMDVQMYGMNGLEATQHIRAHEAHGGIPRTPIIGMTAHALAGDRERCLAAGMDDYIPKPFNPDELKQKLDALTGKE